MGPIERDGADHAEAGQSDVHGERLPQRYSQIPGDEGNQQLQRPCVEECAMSEPHSRCLPGVAVQPEHGVVKSQNVQAIPLYGDRGADDGDTPEVTHGHAEHHAAERCRNDQRVQFEQSCMAFAVTVVRMAPTSDDPAERPRWGRWSSLQVQNIASCLAFQRVGARPCAGAPG